MTRAEAFDESRNAGLIETRALALLRLAVKGAPFLAALREEAASFQALLAEAARESTIVEREPGGSVVQFADPRDNPAKSGPSAAS